MSDFYVSAPDFVSATTREKITPWNSFDDHREFLIERTAIGDIEIKDTLFLLEKYGLCQLRLAGLGPDEETLRNYFKPIGQVMDEQNLAQGEINNLRPETGIEPNTGSSAGDLGFHVDGTQTPNQPALLAFQYVTPAQVGGNSRFVDMTGILFDLPPDVREKVLISLSRSNAAKFVKKGMELVSPIFHFPDGESLACRIRVDNVVSVNDDCKDEFEILRNALLSEKYGVTFKPRPGDIVIFDNWRVCHARDTVLGYVQRHHRRVWMEALRREHQAHYKLGIRPVPFRIKAAIYANQNR